jgi:hypothetical protein
LIGIPAVSGTMYTPLAIVARANPLIFSRHYVSPLFANILHLKSRKRNKPLNLVPPSGRAFFHTQNLTAAPGKQNARCFCQVVCYN